MTDYDPRVQKQKWENNFIKIIDENYDNITKINIEDIPGSIYNIIFDEIGELDSTWIQEFENLDKDYKNYYSEDMSFLIIHSIYINKLNDIEKVRDSGNSNFEGKESQSFDPLTAEEWNVLFAKHMEHHLTQFGV